MSLKKVKQVKADKGFRIWDLAVYGALVALIVVLFFVFVFKGGTPAQDGTPALSSVTITSGFGFEQRTVCTYDFVNDELTISDPEVITVNSSNEEGIELTFHYHGQAEGNHNTIYIDIVNDSVRVTEADCRNKDCVAFPPINNNSSMPITCLTHELIITTNYDDGTTIN